MHKLFIYAFIGATALISDAGAYPLDSDNRYNVTSAVFAGFVRDISVTASCAANTDDIVLHGSCYTSTEDVLVTSGRSGEGWLCVYKNSPGVQGTRTAVATCIHR